MPPRSFRTATPTGRAPVEFELTGTFTTSGDEWAELFTCLPIAPAAVLDDLVSTSASDGRGNIVWNGPSVVRTICGCLPEPAAQRFVQLVYDKERLVDLATLVEVVKYLSDELVRFPTTQPSGSQAGRSDA